MMDVQNDPRNGLAVKRKETRDVVVQVSGVIPQQELGTGLTFLRRPPGHQGQEPWDNIPR